MLNVWNNASSGRCAAKLSVAAQPRAQQHVTNMFSFFKKFKQVQGEPDNEKEKSASPATPARHRSVKKVEELEPDSSLRRTELREHMPDHTMRPEELTLPVPEQHHSNESPERFSSLEKQVLELESDKYVETTYVSEIIISA